MALRELPEELAKLRTRFESEEEGARFFWNPQTGEGSADALGFPPKHAAILKERFSYPYRVLSGTFEAVVAAWTGDTVAENVLTVYLREFCEADVRPDWNLMKMVGAIHALRVRSSSDEADEEPVPVCRSKSQFAFAEARKGTPHASAGQGDVPAPQQMKEWMLGEQAQVLLGQEVVISGYPPGGKETLHHAGKLVGLGNKVFGLVRSSCYNNVAEGCVPHEGGDELVALPVAGWRYTRIVALSLHQTEQARQKMGHQAEAAEKEASSIRSSAEAALAQRDAEIARLRQANRQQEEDARLQSGINSSMEVQMRELQAEVDRLKVSQSSSHTHTHTAPTYTRVKTDVADDGLWHDAVAENGPLPPRTNPQPTDELDMWVKDPVVAETVEEWADRIRNDSAGLILELNQYFVSGLKHGPGGAALQLTFQWMRMWILAAEWTPSWKGTPHRVLGNMLLRELHIQYAFASERVPRKDITRATAQSTPGHEVARYVQTRPPPKSHKGGKGGAAAHGQKTGPPGNGKAGKGKQ